MPLHQLLQKKSISAFIPQEQTIELSIAPSYINKLLILVEELKLKQIDAEHIDSLVLIAESCIKWLITDHRSELNVSKIEKISSLVNKILTLLEQTQKGNARVEVFKKNQESSIIKFFNLQLSKILEDHPKDLHLSALNNYLTKLSFLLSIINIKLLDTTTLKVLTYNFFYILNTFFSKCTNLEESDFIALVIYPNLRGILQQIISSKAKNLESVVTIVDYNTSISRFFIYILSNLSYLLSRNYNVLFEQEKNAVNYLKVMEYDIAPLLKTFNAGNYDFFSHEIDTIERYITQRIELLGTTFDKNNIDESAKLLDKFYMAFKKTNKLNLAYKCLRAYGIISAAYMAKSDFKSAQLYLDRTENCQHALKKMLKTAKMDKKLALAFSQQMVVIEKANQGLRKDLNEILQLAYIGHLEKTQLFKLTVLDMEMIQLQPIQKPSSTTDQFDKIYRILKKSNLKVSKSIRTDCLIIHHILTMSPDEFKKSIDEVCKQIEALHVKKEEQPEVEKQEVTPPVIVEQSKQEIKEQVVAPTEKATPKIEKINSPQLSKRGKKNESVTKSPVSQIKTPALKPKIKVEDKILETYTLHQRDAPKDIYTVQISPKLIKKLAEHELNKLHSLLLAEEFGCKNPHSSGIFQVKPNKMKTDIFSTAEKKKTCIKIKLAKEDVRFFATVEVSKDGKKSILLDKDKMTRNVH